MNIAFIPNRSRALVGALLCLTCFAPVAAGQFTATFDFSTGSSHVLSFDYNGSDIPDLLVSPITKNGIDSSSSAGNFRANDWSMADERDLTDYFEVTFTPLEGSALTLNTIDFGVGRSGTGPRFAGWSSDSDYNALLPVAVANAQLSHSNGALSIPDLNTGFLGNTITLSAEFSNITSARTFRFYMWDAETAAGTGGLQGALSFTGSVSAVPEPHTYAAIFGGAVLAFAWFNRRAPRRDLDAAPSLNSPAA